MFFSLLRFEGDGLLRSHMTDNVEKAWSITQALVRMINEYMR